MILVYKFGIKDENTIFVYIKYAELLMMFINDIWTIILLKEVKTKVFLHAYNYLRFKEERAKLMIFCMRHLLITFCFVKYGTY